MKYAQYSGGESYDWNIPQMLFCENVMPITRGIMSTYFIPQVSAFGGTAFDQGIILRDSNENNSLLVPANGLNYLLNPNTGVWMSSLPFTPTGKLITRAYVQGRTFICYEKQKIFEYDGTTQTLIDQTAAFTFSTGYSIGVYSGDWRREQLSSCLHRHSSSMEQSK